MEYWKPIRGYEPYYEVSNEGRIRTWKNGAYGLSDSPKIMKPASQGKTNHQRISLRKDGKSRSLLVHRIVADSFIKPLSSNELVCHKDDNGFNNHVSNLYIGDHSSNFVDSVKNNRRIMPKGMLNGRSILTPDQVRYIRSVHGKIRQVDLADKFNVTQVCISRIQLRKTWAHIA